MLLPKTRLRDRPTSRGELPDPVKIITSRRSWQRTSPKLWTWLSTAAWPIYQRNWTYRESKWIKQWTSCRSISSWSTRILCQVYKWSSSRTCQRPTERRDTILIIFSQGKENWVWWAHQPPPMKITSDRCIKVTIRIVWLTIIVVGLFSMREMTAIQILEIQALRQIIWAIWPRKKILRQGKGSSKLSWSHKLQIEQRPWKDLALKVQERRLLKISLPGSSL